MAQGMPLRLGPTHLIAIATVVASAILLAAPLWTAEPQVAQGAGVIVFAVAMWATGFIPPHVTVLLYFLIAVVLKISPPEVVFFGFQSSASWLVFGGLAISLAAQRSGLAARIVQMLITHLPTRYFAMALGLGIAGMALAFIMPAASSRVVLLAPIAVALGERLGFPENSRARFGLVMAVGWGTTIPAFGILPANVVNMAFVGAAEGIYGIDFTYFEYIILNLPVMGVLGMLIMAALITAMFGAEPVPPEAERGETMWSPDERKLLAILMVALALWATDFAHGISPAWVALGAAMLCITPGIGMISSKSLTSDINYGSWLFVCGVIGIGAIANDTGLGGALGEWLLANVPLTRDGGIVAFYEIFAISSVVGLATTWPAAPPIVTAFSDAIAQATNWPLTSVLLAQVPSWQAYPLPHQAPPVAIAMALGGVPMKEGARLLIPYFLIALVVLLPLQYLWGVLLGAYPG